MTEYILITGGVVSGLDKGIAAASIIIKKGRQGEYLGKTVQVIPHVSDMIKSAVESVSDCNDIVICEIKKTVGGIESLPWLEGTPQMRLGLGLHRGRLGAPAPGRPGPGDGAGPAGRIAGAG